MVTLADSSAWIEYLRATESPVDLALDALVKGQGDLVTTEVVVMEVMAGARTDKEREELRRLLRRFPLLPSATSPPTSRPPSSTAPAAARARPCAR